MPGVATDKNTPSVVPVLSKLWTSAVQAEGGAVVRLPRRAPVNPVAEPADTGGLLTTLSEGPHRRPRLSTECVGVRGDADPKSVRILPAVCYLTGDSEAVGPSTMLSFAWSC